MKKICLAAGVIVSLIPSGLKAQFDYVKPDDIDMLHKRTIIVVVESLSDDISGKLTRKKKDPDAYKNAVQAYNKGFEDAMTKYWKLSEGSIEYKTADEINDITDKKDYAVVFCRSAKQSELTQGYTAINGVLYWPDMKEVAHDKDYMGKMTVMGISLLEKFNKTPMYQFPIPDVFPTRADLEYAVNAANTYIEYRENHKKDAAKKLDEQMLQENQPNLKDKTLLLRRDWLDKKLTQADIQKYYPFEFMIAGKDTVERAIDSADAKYAVAMVTPYDLATSGTGGVEYVEYVYSPDDGSILASSGIPDMASAQSGATNTVNEGKPIITKKSLMDFCLYIKDDDGSDKGAKKKHK